MGKIGIIAAREFNERVRKKSFIITTIAMPVAFVAIMAIMVLMMTMGSKTKNIEVIDNSGIIVSKLENTSTLRFSGSDRTLEEIKAEKPEGVFGILVIGKDVVENSKNIQFYTFQSSTIDIEEEISGQIRGIIEDEKLKTYNIDNLAQIMEEVKTNVSLYTMQISDSGDMKESSSALSMAVASIFGFLIYMFVILYGSMVMQGVIEEKTSKVLELMVSSVKPFQLMMGKILGIASVAITQLLIWVVFIAIAGGAITTFFMGDMVEAAKTVQESGVAMQGMNMNGLENLSDQQIAIIKSVTDVGYLLKLGIGFLLYFIGGYLLYAAMFAAVGSAVDNEKDTQNLQMPITIPLLIAIVVMMNTMRDPNGSLSFWFSMIPFTSPIVMMSRLPYGVPTWELLTSIALLYATFIAIVWIAGKIYRVGIFMYGKKPTFSELYKWIKYK